jgi:glycosyltransferase involved in cell wall biosynthesis
LPLAPAPELTVLIPAYNEEKRMESCLERLEAFLAANHSSAEILISEDGSTDRTVEIIGSFKARPGLKVPIIFLHSDKRLGKGGGLKRGIQEAKGTYTVFTDTDLPVPLEAFTRALQLLKGGADVVQGSRVMKGSSRNEPFKRRLLSRGFHYLARVMLGVRWDSQCGFKAFRTSMGREAFSRIANPGFAFDVEFLIQAQKLRARIVEMPVEWHYNPDSSMRLRRDILGMFSELLHIFAQAHFH